MPGPRSPYALQPADYADMREQTHALARRAAQAGLVQIAYALEMVMALLDEAARASGGLANPDQT